MPESNSEGWGPEGSTMQPSDATSPYPLNNPDMEEDSISGLTREIAALAASPLPKKPREADLDVAAEFISNTNTSGPSLDSTSPSLEPNRSSMVSFESSAPSDPAKPQVEVSGLQSEKGAGLSPDMTPGTEGLEDSPFCLGPNQNEAQDALFFDHSAPFEPTGQNSMELHPMFNPNSSPTETPGNAPKRKKDLWVGDEEQGSNGHAHHPENNHLHKHKAFVQIDHGRTRDPAVLAEARDITCGILSRDHPFRRWCFNIYKSPQANLFFMFVSVTNSLVIAIAPEFYDTARQVLEARWMLVFDVSCCCVFAFEVLVGCVSLGWDWFLHDDSHKLEAFVLLAAVIEYIAEALSSRFATLRPFRLVRLFKPLSRVPGFSDIRRIIGTLSEGVGQFSTVFAMLLIFCAAFGIFGMALFSSKFRNQCVASSRRIPSCASDFTTAWAPTCNFSEPLVSRVEPQSTSAAFSGGFPHYRLCRILSASDIDDPKHYPFDPSQVTVDSKELSGFYHTCQLTEHLAGLPVTQTCAQLLNPGSGFAHFDHFGGAMMAVAQIAVPDSQYLVLHWSLEAASGQSALTWLMFFLVTCLCTFLLLSLFVAVVTGTFKRVREEQERQEGGDRPMIVTQSLVDHMQYQGATPLASNYGSQVRSLRQFERMRRHEEDVEFQQQVRRIVYTPAVQHFFHLVVIVDVVALAADEHDSTQFEAGVAQWSHFACSWILLSEMFMRFVAAGAASSFWKHSFHKFEVIVGVAGLIGQVTEIEILELLPCIRIYRLMVYFPTLYQLLMSTLAAIPAILNLCLVIGGIAVCFAVTGRYVIDADMNAYRSNFGSFPNAMLTVFQLLTGDSWSSVVHTAMATKDQVAAQIMACLLLIAWFVFSKLIISNIFVSIIIENFDVSKTIDNIQEPGRMAWIRHRLDAAWAHVTTRWSFRLVSLRITDIPTPPPKRPASQYLLLEHLRSNVNATKDLAEFGVGSVASNFVSMKPESSGLSSMPRQQMISMTPNRSAGAAEEALSDDMQSKSKGQVVPTDSSHSNASNGTQAVRSAGSNGVTNLSNGSHAPSTGAMDSQTVLDKDNQPQGPEGVLAARKLPPPLTEASNLEPGLIHNSTTAETRIVVAGTASYGPLSVSPVAAARPDAQVNSRVNGGTKKAGKKAFGMVRGLTIKKLVQQASSLESPTNQSVDEELIGPEVNLGIFRPMNPIRRFCEHLVAHIMFELIIGVAISVSCFVFIFTGAYDDTPVGEPAWPAAAWRTGLNMFATVVFTLEFFVRIIADGLLLTRNAYFKSNWNTVDFLVLLFSWIDESNLFPQGQVAKVFRLARALRPLRVMKRNEGMRVVLDALFSTLAPVGYVLIFSMVNICVFAIFGMGLFGGKLFFCSTPGAEYPGGKLQCMGNHIDKSTGVMVPRSWRNADYHFDTIFEAIYTLFRINTVKYVGVLANVMDITDVNQSPKMNHSSGNAAYFVIFLVIGVLFIWNLLLGFIVDGFYAIRGKSPVERGFERFLRQLRAHRPARGRYKEPTNALAQKLRPVVDSRLFQWWSMACVITNVTFMMAEHRDQSEQFSRAVDIQNIIFCVELLIECALFGIAYGMQGFAKDLWKAFDLFIGIGTFIGAVSNNPSITQPANAFRLFRVLRLMAMISHIRIILETLLASLPQLGNILLLLFLVYSMFAVVAVEAFGRVKYGIRLGTTANFETWFNAMKVCYQMVVGDEWHELMTDSRIQYPYCTKKFTSADLVDYSGPELDFGDCGTRLAPIFFILFKLLCEAMMLNLFIGMILDNFSFITDEIAQEEDEEWSNGASAAQIKELVDTFKKFDAGTGYLPLTAYRSTVLEMPTPLGFRHHTFHDIKYGKAERAVEKLMLAELHLVVRSEREEMKEVMEAWWRKALKAVLPAAFHSRRRFFHAVAYEEVMLTMFYWRKPDMVPDQLKLARADRLQEVVLMTYAITLKNFFAKLVAKKKRERVKNGLNKLTSKENVFGSNGTAGTDAPKVQAVPPPKHPVQETTISESDAATAIAAITDADEI